MFGRRHVDWCTVVPPSLVAIDDTCFEPLSRGPAIRLEILNMPIEVCGQKGVPIKEFGCSFPLELPGYCAGSKITVRHAFRWRRRRSDFSEPPGVPPECAGCGTF